MNYTQGLPKVKDRAVIDYSGQGGNVQDQLSLDVTNWTRNQIIELLRSTAAEETLKQMAIGNVPQVVISDNTKDKPAALATRIIEVGFGQRLKPQALSTLKNLLARAIARSTSRQSGALANMSNWEFVYIKDGKSSPVPIGNRAGIPMSEGAAIVLRPTGVDHATVANISAKGSRDRATARKRAASGKAATPGKGRGKGFMGQVSAQARRSPVFSGFNVAVRFTGYVVRGEKWVKHGPLTATIMITLAAGKRRGRRR